MKKSVIIIGAGLSGLYAATLLQEVFEVTIVEARERIGGRVLTIDEHDLGPSWIWSHQKEILALISALKLELFAQHTQGDALFQGQKVERFTLAPQAPSARIKGGVGALIEALHKHLKKTRVLLKHEVTALEQTQEGIDVVTTQGVFKADFVLNTLPPRVASKVHYTPSLGEGNLKMLNAIPTWMGYITKVVIEYEIPFWRSEGLSGFVFSHSTPLGEIHDACTGSKAALFGFVSSKYEGHDLQADVIAQLVTLFGEKAQSYTAFYSVNWNKELFTATIEDQKALAAHPHYGYELTHFNERLFFLGTESSAYEGGYLEGALHSAKVTAQKVLASS